MNTALLCKNVLDVVPKGPPTPTPVTTVVEKSQVIIVPDGSSIAEDTDAEENVATVPPEITVDTSLSEKDESDMISALNDSAHETRQYGKRIVVLLAKYEHFEV